MIVASAPGRDVDSPGVGAGAVADLAKHYDRVRRFSELLVKPLAPEDCVAQTMPDVSPTKWHVAHTTWFFETLVLHPYLPGYKDFNPAFRFLFNSYYNTVGEQFPRPCRGQLTRPTLDEVMRYRRHVDEHMMRLFDGAADTAAEWSPIAEIGLQHEQQHQELILTDIKHVFWCNPLEPAYREREPDVPTAATPLQWHAYDGGVHEMGFGGEGFSYDNERPRHKVYLQPFQIASRCVTNGEFVAFIDDGGYQRPELWLSDGWNKIQEEQWKAPLYWRRQNGNWHTMTLAGCRPLNHAEPVCHVSYFEADAYARWADGVLPTESMWEAAASAHGVAGNFVETDRLHPAPAEANANKPAQMFGDVWEWTHSAYVGYPGFVPARGALGEYNGKFMCNQMVLRGGSCVSPQSHLRATYRNFFPPSARWQFSGLRLARWES